MSHSPAVIDEDSRDVVRLASIWSFHSFTRGKEKAKTEGGYGGSGDVVPRLQCLQDSAFRLGFRNQCGDERRGRCLFHPDLELSFSSSALLGGERARWL